MILRLTTGNLHGAIGTLSGLSVVASARPVHGVIAWLAIVATQPNRQHRSGIRWVRVRGEPPVGELERGGVNLGLVLIACAIGLTSSNDKFLTA